MSSSFQLSDDPDTIILRRLSSTVERARDESETQVLPAAQFFARATMNHERFAADTPPMLP